MKTKWCLFLFLSLLILLNVFYYTKENVNYFDDKYVTVISSGKRKLERKEEHQYEITVYFPHTPFVLLNKEITSRLNQEIQTFQEEMKDVSAQEDFIYTLYIRYEEYFYEDFLSYVFFIETYTGGAHPNHKIWTVTYDKKRDFLIDISYLLRENPNLLNIFSHIARKELIHHSGIVDVTMLMEGTRPKEKNFSRFAFSKDGLILFFDYYQVAPYSSGSFQVVVPYQEIF